MTSRAARLAVAVASTICITAFSALTACTADSHDFYAYECCHDRDCAPLPDGAVRATPDGWLIVPTGMTVPFGDRRLRHAPDGRFHACFIGGDPKAALLCLYVPGMGS